MKVSTLDSGASETRAAARACAENPPTQASRITWMNAYKRLLPATECPRVGERLPKLVIVDVIGPVVVIMHVNLNATLS
jgi:hypothetical protein